MTFEELHDALIEHESSLKGKEAYSKQLIFHYQLLSKIKVAHQF